MKKSIVVMTALLSLTFVGNALAGSISNGSDDRGVKLNYEGLNLGSKGVVRFSLECVKNWGGQTGGVATVVAYYLDASGEIKQASDSVSCHVKGGLDGARKRSTGSAKSVTIPVPLSEAEVRAYIDYKDISNTDELLKHIENEVNKAFKKATLGAVGPLISVGKTLEEAVAPVGGVKLTF
jgi:hypothetical protein